MHVQESVRRPSYGPTSPAVGESGSRTRERILAESLHLFGNAGFYQTSVQDIARAAGVSRATLYQYFESREQIFVELLNKSGRELAAIGHALGRLGPDASGFRELRKWVDSAADVYDRYATLFFEWTNVRVSEVSIGAMVTSFQVSFNQRIARILKECGVRGIDAEDAAVILTNVVLRWNYHRQLRPRALPVDQSGYHLAVLLQLMLFPETPPKSLRPGRDEPIAWFSARPPSSLRPRRSRATPTERYYSRLASLSPRNAATVCELTRAGLQLFAERGYHATNVDEIVTRVDYTRGTYYKYFDDKVDLLVLLSDDCCQELMAVARRLSRLRDLGDDPIRFRIWVSDALSTFQRFQGVWRAWPDRTLFSELQEPYLRVIDAFRRSLQAALSDRPRQAPLDLETATVFMTSLFEELPEGFRLNERAPDDATLAELTAVVLERSLLGGGRGDR